MDLARDVFDTKSAPRLFGETTKRIISNLATNDISVFIKRTYPRGVNNYSPTRQMRVKVRLGGQK
jgi:hypothetical protein